MIGLAQRLKVRGSCMEASRPGGSYSDWLGLKTESDRKFAWR